MFRCAGGTAGCAGKRQAEGVGGSGEKAPGRAESKTEEGRCEAAGNGAKDGLNSGQVTDSAFGLIQLRKLRTSATLSASI